ncbi:hypothetical protein MCAP1_003614 [Malassezia caprae]|uniref:Uncharacterized protein n=1 Tax=Malassezia caprae TaxID=1381934 RepID=A0AAF0IXR3_9BASI|nr:hypothetical protein MCAP1_003614 [Malassezia caprae]
MLFQLVPLALLPLAALASPVVERSADHKDLFCFRKGQDQIYSINKTATKNVCGTLSSGTIQKDTALEACRVKDYDIKWFQERCESRNSKSDASQWKAGSKLDVVWEPEDPYDLYCFVKSTTFDESPHDATTKIASDATPDVCHKLNSGKYQDGPTKHSCRVAKEEVDAFKKGCEKYYPTGYPPSYSEWIPGTSLKPVI